MFEIYIKRSVLFGILVLLFASCSTVLNKRKVAVYVYSDVDSAQVYINGNNTKATTPAKIYLERSKKDIALTLKMDSISKEIILKRKISKMYWFGNLFTFAGVGYLIDLSNPKRFSYKRNNSIHFTDTCKIFRPSKFNIPVKGQINLKFSIPESNHFYINQGYGYGNSFGFLGISGGIEYYFKDLYSVNIDVGGITDFLIPFPGAVDYHGTYSRSFASYMDLQVGKDFNAFHIDLGVQTNRTSYYKRQNESLYPVYIDTLLYSVQQYNTGFAFSGYYKLTNGFNIGMNYYPSFLSWNNGVFDTHYTHLIMFELLFKIKAYSPNRKAKGAYFNDNY